MALSGWHNHQRPPVSKSLQLMVEVFKTNVEHATQAAKLVALLLQHFPDSRVNFDLEDCDRILRIEGQHFIAEKVQLLVNGHGFSCQVLED